jgi:TRAP-type C4-dicarboxylate transport system permease small subunit
MKQESKEQRSGFDKVDQVIYKLLRYISYGATFFLFVTMMIAVINVVLEKLHKLGVPVSGIGDTVNWIKYMNVCVVYLCTAYITLERGHSGIDLLTRHYPKIVQRILSGIAYLAGAVVIGYISYLGYVKVFAGQLANNARINDTLATSFPQWPFGLVYFVGMGLLSFSCLWAFVRICFGRKPAQEAVDPEEVNAELRAEDEGNDSKEAQQ